MNKVFSFTINFFTDRKLYYFLTGLILFGGVMLIVMDRIIMPQYTLYGHGVTIPAVNRMSLEEAQKKLKSHGLRYALAAKRSNDAFPPDFVIDQTPGAGMIVKPNRKVYLTVNANTSPTVEVPNIENLSLRNATIQLQNSGLQVGNINYESSRFRNSVLKQSISAGRRVNQSTLIDLIVGDGLGSSMVQIPDITDLHLSAAQNKLREAGLRVGSIRFEQTDRVPPNTILGYDPDNEPAVYEGTVVDLVVSVSSSEVEEQETGPVIINETEQEEEASP